MKCFPTQNTKQSPWWVVNADDKRRARLNTIHHLLSLIPYKELPPQITSLPERTEGKGYVRTPFEDQTFCAGNILVLGLAYFSSETNL